MQNNMHLLNEQFNFYHAFQPIVHLSTNKIHGYEALLRSSQFENPDVFFRHASKHNQLFELDVASISKALKSLNQKSPNLNYSTLFINVFPSTLTNPTFQQNITNLRTLINVTPGSIVFEIIESEKTPIDLDDLKKSISDLKKQGFLVAIGDFGKGSSGIRAILEIEPHIVKLDRCFTHNLSKTPKKQKMIRSLLQLFDNQVMTVLEGVESYDDLQIARELGVAYGQGFFMEINTL